MFSNFGIPQFASQESKYQKIIDSMAEAYGIDSRIISAVIATESSWKPDASRSDEDSVGIMQVRPGTASGVLQKTVTAQMLLDPYTNIQAGSAYLAKQMKRYNNNPTDAYSAYNMGSVKKNQDGTYVNQSHVNNFIKWFNAYTGSNIPTRMPKGTKTLIGIGGISIAVLVGVLFLMPKQKRA